jgi:hypothetical protein
VSELEREQLLAPAVSGSVGVKYEPQRDKR